MKYRKSKHKGLYLPRYEDEKGRALESKVWWMRYSCRRCPIHPHGGQHRESTETKKVTDAQRILDQKKGVIADGKRFLPTYDRITVTEILDAVSLDYANKGRKSTDGVKRNIKNHLTPYFGHRPAVSLSGAEIRTYIQGRLSAGAAPAQVNRELAVLRRAYILSLKDGTLLTRPHFELLPERNQRKGFFTDEEFGTLCKHLPDEIRAPVIFMHETGWRIIESLSREWRHVDFETGTVILEGDETKNEQSRVFPLTQRLRNLLAEQKRKTQAVEREKGILIPFVFHVQGDRLYTGVNPPKPTKEFRKAWKSACEQGKLVGRVPHDFRRTAARNLIEAGIDEQTAMDLLGHKTPSIFRRYRIVTDRERFDAVRKLDEADKNRKARGRRKSASKVLAK